MSCRRVCPTKFSPNGSSFLRQSTLALAVGSSISGVVPGRLSSWLGMRMPMP
jgi:hypothetical protein